MQLRRLRRDVVGYCLLPSFGCLARLRTRVVRSQLSLTMCWLSVVASLLGEHERLGSGHKWLSFEGWIWVVESQPC